MATRSWSREGEGKGEGKGEEDKKKRTATRMGNEMEVVLCSCYRHVLAMQRTVLPSSLSASFLMWNIGCVW